MNALLVFGIIFLVSAFGSLQLGLVNSRVICTALSDDHKHAKMIAYGGAIPEIVYAGIAILFLHLVLMISNSVLHIISILSAFLILGVGIYIYKHRPTMDAVCESDKEAPMRQNRKYFFLGVKLGFSNPQLLPFWFVVGTTLQTYLSLRGALNVTAFVAGSALGALAVLLFFASATRYIFKKYARFISAERAHKLVGAFLILVGLKHFFVIVRNYLRVF